MVPTDVYAMLEATHAPAVRLPNRNRGLCPPRARIVG
uniref:Uncharacterized protein n=1 Tax=Solanum lycopersicum TaxID=4081 RepID=A0A494G8J3_SOLLC